MHRLTLAQRGFTLLELMVTLTVMAITMTVLLKASSEQQDQLRYNVTVERLERTKKAIVDVANINGVPMVSGFAADMGRLPKNLHELLEPQFCPMDVTGLNCGGQGLSTATAWGIKAICQDGTRLNPSANPPVVVCPNAGYVQAALVGGWHGPYLQVSHHPGHVDANNCSDAFTDGWGNSACVQLFPEKRHNYGWYFNLNNDVLTSNPLCDSPAGTGGCLTMFSYGDGCYQEPDICKGSNGDPEPFDFTYPLSASPQYEGLVYDANSRRAITPDAELTVQLGLVLPASGQPKLPPPLIKPQEWQVNLGDTGVDVVISSKSFQTKLDCSGIQTPICLNVYYFSYEKAEVVSSNATIVENCMVLPVHFAFPATASIPVGNAAFSIHEGPCQPAPMAMNSQGTTTATYPAPRQPAPVRILPGQIPSFTW